MSLFKHRVAAIALVVGLLAFVVGCSAPITGESTKAAPKDLLRKQNPGGGRMGPGHDK